jgi:perosamine synthetase
MREPFVIAKDPKLHWSMLFPSVGKAQFFALPSRSTYYLFWARNAIYHGLRALNVRAGENVLVPSYHCTSVVEPILQYGGDVKFYNVGLDLQPDIDDIEKKIDAKTRVVLVIHYFGFPQPIVKIKEFCQERGLYLIEDCAHVLQGRTEEGIVLGTSGDISIFSWRKFLPVYDGGQLVINNPALKLDSRWDSGSPLFTLKIAKNLLDKLMEDSNSRLVKQIAKLSHTPSAIFRRVAAANGYDRSISTVNSYDLDFDLASANLKMSGLSQYIMGNTDIGDVADKRRRNYRLLAEAIKPMEGVRALYPSLPNYTVPWVFPLLTYGVENLHLRLREQRIPATNWSGVIHRSLLLNRFPDARVLYDNIVFLPIHQSLQEYEIETMLRVLGEVLGKSVKSNAKGFDGRLSLSAISRG